jgi:hypothetical protein
MKRSTLAAALSILALCAGAFAADAAMAPVLVRAISVNIVPVAAKSKPVAVGRICIGTRNRENAWMPVANHRGIGCPGERGDFAVPIGLALSRARFSIARSESRSKSLPKQTSDWFGVVVNDHD